MILIKFIGIILEGERKKIKREGVGEVTKKPPAVFLKGKDYFNRSKLNTCQAYTGLGSYY